MSAHESEDIPADRRAIERGSCNDPCDCLVVGGGPAGLMAALYLRRYHRGVLLVDAGHSRAMYIDRSHNYPGFPEGIAGDELLTRMRQQLIAVGGRVHPGEVTALELATLAPQLQTDDRLGATAFAAHIGGRRVTARSVMIASGVVDGVPDLPGIDELRQSGMLRQCPICDGHEHRNQRIVVIGDGAHAAREAAFIANYSAEVSWCALRDEGSGAEVATPSCVRRLPRAKRVGVNTRMRPGAGAAVMLQTVDGAHHRFDVVYAALGVQPRSQIARSLGAQLDARNNIIVDAHCESSVPGLFAAGDVVSALDQLAVAVGHGAIAATAIHNRLPPQVAAPRAGTRLAPTLPKGSDVVGPASVGVRG